MLTKWMRNTAMVCAFSFALSSCQTTPPASTDASEDLSSGSSADMSKMVAPDAGPDLGSMDAGGGDMSSAAPPPNYCVKACTQASDCARDSGANSADNYACQAGACKFLGCFTNSECATTYGGNYVCPTGGSGPRICVQACNQASDCAVDSGANSADNYACQGGACQYLGCATDGECVTSVGAGTVCGSVTTIFPGLPRVRYCAKGCTQASDCAVDSGANSADNYSCQAGACKYLGCLTSNECVATVGAGSVCP